MDVQLRGAVSGMTGCPPDTITFENMPGMFAYGGSFTAKCQGRTFYCQYTGDKNKSCTEAVATKNVSAKQAPTIQAPVETPIESSSILYSVSRSNIRSEPNDKSKIIYKTSKGIKLIKIKSSGDWVNVKLPSGMTGWIHQGLVTTTMTEETQSKSSTDKAPQKSGSVKSPQKPGSVKSASPLEF